MEEACRGFQMAVNDNDDGRRLFSEKFNFTVARDFLVHVYLVF